MKFDILKPEAVSGVGSNGIDGGCIFPAIGEATIHDKLFVVADESQYDGSGKKAAEYFARTFSDHMFQNTCSDEPLAEDVFKEALFAAKDRMDEECPDSMGTQYGMVYFHRHGVLAAHVGAVRIYHVRPKERRLLYKSRDDGRMLVPGTKPLNEPVKAYITNVKYGDYFVIMSKGACQAISDREVMDVMCEPVNDKTKSVRLMKLADAGDSSFAVCIIHISGVMNEAMDEGLFQNEGKLMAAMLANSDKGKDNAVAEDKSGRVGQSLSSVRAKKKEHVKTPELEMEMSPQSENDEGGRREFPIVTVTALALVLLAVGIWFWAQKPDDKEGQEEKAMVKAKQPQEKDTINILKNSRPKPVDIDDPNAKDKKEEEKKEAVKPQVEKPAVVNSVEAGDPDNVADPQAVGTSVSPAQEPAVNQSSATTPPATTAPSPATTPPATTSPPSDGTVTPRPVIPEGE